MSRDDGRADRLWAVLPDVRDTWSLCACSRLLDRRAHCEDVNTPSLALSAQARSARPRTGQPIRPTPGRQRLATLGTAAAVHSPVRSRKSGRRPPNSANPANPDVDVSPCGLARLGTMSEVELTGSRPVPDPVPDTFAAADGFAATTGESASGRGSDGLAPGSFACPVVTSASPNQCHRFPCPCRFSSNPLPVNRGPRSRGVSGRSPFSSHHDRYSRRRSAAET